MNEKHMTPPCTLPSNHFLAASLPICNLKFVLFAFSRRPARSPTNRDRNEIPFMGCIILLAMHAYFEYSRSSRGVNKLRGRLHQLRPHDG